MDDQPIPFHFTDPRHERIYRRLSLIGPGPAAFYKDACNMMTQDDLATKTHQVSHSLREVESSMRAVLASIADPELRKRLAEKAKGNKEHESDVRAILQALAIDEEEPVAKRWLQLTKRETGLAAGAHRHGLLDPREADEAFLERWEELNDILDRVLDRFEAIYLRVFQTIDTLVLKEEPDGEDLGTLGNHLPNNEVVARQFFDHLQHPGWLDPLQEAGFFRRKAPHPEVVPDSGGTRHRYWPQSRYLARMALSKDEGVQKKVLNISKDVQDCGNAFVQNDIIDTCMALPPDLCAQLSAKTLGWQWPDSMVSYKISQLILHLIERAEVESALRLADRFFKLEVRPREPYELPDGTLHTPVPDLQTKLDRWRYRDSLLKFAKKFSEIEPARSFEWARDLLSQSLRLTTRATDNNNDDSYIWRPAIEDHEKNSDFDLRDAQVVALRDAALESVKTNSSSLLGMVTALESQQWCVFRRVALFILAEFGTSIDDVAQRLTSREMFESLCLQHEFECLLAKRFGKLKQKDQEKILEYIDEGPPHLAWRRKLHREKTGEEMPENEAERITSLWERDRLHPFHDSLPSEWWERYDSYVRRYGPKQEPFLGARSVGPGSPKTLEELRKMAAKDIADFLLSWEPEEVSPFSFEEPTHEGLGRDLERVVAERPDEFAREAEHFRNLDPTDVRHYLSGLEGAVKEKRLFEWEPVLNLMKWAVDQPVEIPGRVQADPFDKDPDWSWTRKQIARLINAGFGKAETEIPFALRMRVWEILEPICEDPNPTAEYEKQYGGSNMDPATLARNTTRGEAMLTAVAYGLWVRRNLGQPTGDATTKRVGLSAMPELQVVLDRHLDHDIDPSVAIRGVYGQRLEHLAYLDQEWCRASLDKLFPVNPELARYRDVVWQAFVLSTRPHPELFDLLKDHYERAVDSIGPEDVQWSHLDKADEHLATHLVLLYMWGTIELNSGLLSRFFEKAPEGLRAYAMNVGGRALMDNEELPAEALSRLQDLWAARFRAANADVESSRKEIGAFGRWFASGKFDDVWSLEQLAECLRLARKVQADNHVLRRLSKLTVEHPLPVITSLQLFLAGDLDAWFFHSSTGGEIRRIIGDVLQSGNEQAENRAAEMVNRLAAQGHPEFRDLL